MAIGSDYGLVVLRGVTPTAFPFPPGARHEMRDIQDLAWDGEWLHVVSAKNAYRWNLKDKVHTVSFPRDKTGGFEELRGVFSGPDGLIEAWRTRWVLNGTSHPAEDFLCMASNSTEVFCGSRSGNLSLLGGDCIAQFEGPIRHMIWAHGRLWIAATKALWTLFPGSQPVQIKDTEPFGLCTDPFGRLWCLGAKDISCSTEGDSPAPVDLPIARPWAIGANSAGLWVGQKGGLSRWLWASESRVD
jgi:hypothetical protein